MVGEYGSFNPILEHVVRFDAAVSDKLMEPPEPVFRRGLLAVELLDPRLGLGIGFHPPVDDGLQQHFPPLNLLDGQGWKVSDRLPGHALYTDPPLGGRHDGGGWGRPSPPLLIGEQLMNRVGRAVEKAEALGFMKVVMDAETQRILGAAIFGTGGDEAIHGLLDIMHANAPCAVFQRAVPIHPTVSERIPTLLGR